MELNNTTYGRWSIPYRETNEVFDEAEARRRHDAGEEYWVWWGDPTSPDLVMQVEPQFVGVIEVFWLDDHNRYIEIYTFVPEDKSRRHDRTQRLFLEQCRQFTYGTISPDNLIDSKDSHYTAFQHDGSAYHERKIDGVLEEAQTPPLPAEEAQHLLFEPWPTFGNWERITRQDRRT